MLGWTAAHFIAGTLLISSLLTYTPLGTWIESLVTAISPKTTAVAQRGGQNAAQAAAQRQRQYQHQEQSQSRYNGRGVLSSF